MSEKEKLKEQTEKIWKSVLEDNELTPCQKEEILRFIAKVMNHLNSEHADLTRAKTFIGRINDIIHEIKDNKNQPIINNP